MKGRGFVFGLAVLLGAGFTAAALSLYPFAAAVSAEETPIVEADTDTDDADAKVPPAVVMDQPPYGL